MEERLEPRISVVVPVYNDAGGIRATVRSLVEQDFRPARYEVIVIDNGSEDGTLTACREMGSRYPSLVSVEQERRIRSSYAARNKGIAASRGEIICFVDADMVVPPSYLSQVFERFEREDIDYLGARVEIIRERGTRIENYYRSEDFDIENYLQVLHFAPTCCLSVRRSVLQSVGSFDGRLESGGDMEFGHRVYEAGFRQGYADEIVLQHPPRGSYRALCEKVARVARGRAQLGIHYPERYKNLNPLPRLRSYLPKNPIRIKSRYAALGHPISLAEAVLVSFWVLPLKWARPYAYFKESRRLRRDRREYES